jgi:GT2 family glycosyltransferase
MAPDSQSHQSRIYSLEQRLASKDMRLAEQKRVIDSILHSRSWRWTEKLRAIAFTVRRLLGRQDPSHPSVVFHASNRRTDRVLKRGNGQVAFKHGFAQSARIVLEEYLASGARLVIPTSDKPLVSVVLVVCNRAELTLPCLRSLAEQRGIRFELIVVDNASTDRMGTLFDRVDGARILRNSENLYYVHAVNQGAALARGSYVLLLNNDAILLPGTLSTLADTMESSSDIGVVGGKMVFLDGRLQEAGSIIWNDGTCFGYGRGDHPLAPPYMYRRDVDYCSGALFLTRKDLFDRLGGFAEDFSPAYYEETDYCMRIWGAGFRVVFEPRASILHYEFASRTPEEASQLQSRHRRVFVERNRVRLKAHHPSSEGNIILARHAGPPRQRVLMIDDRVPHPHLGAGFPRANRMLTRLVEWQAIVTMYPTHFYNEDWSDVYSDIPREVEVMLGPGMSGLGTFLKEPHLEQHPEWFTKTRIIYDAEAIVSARELLKQEILGNIKEANRQRELVTEEIQLARAAHTVLSVSEVEAQSFRSEGVQTIEVLGHAIEANPTPQDFADRSGFLFVGAVYDDESPNADAVIWLAEEIMPKIRRVLGKVPLTIVGINESDRIWAMDSDGIRILGPHKHLRPLYESTRVFIAPTRFSAGIPHKVHEAAANGVPVVATPLLAGQLGWIAGEEILVGNTAEELATRAIELYMNPVKWRQLRLGALERVRQDCSVERFDRTLRDVVSVETPALVGTPELSL